jgi:hypothetical protein
LAKKYKIQKKSSKPATIKSSSKPAAPASSKIKVTASLIAFDKRTKLFLLILITAYLIMSLLKIHTSSIANWEKVFGKDETEAVITGQPRWIRMDEWMTETPTLIGQYNAGMPISNKAIGGGNAPVILGWPVKDMISILRPSVWSYFLFDVERAFAFSWNFTIFFFLISTFLLFMLLTGNNFWLSVFGSFFIFLSSAVQWWSYEIGTFMIYANGALISFIYILYAKKILPLIIASAIFPLSIFGYLFHLYPPFQVPIVYLYLFIFFGFLAKKKDFKSIKQKGLVKIGLLAFILIILGVFVYHYYVLVKDTYGMMLNTVYPGRRVSTGGDLVTGKLFSEFFVMFLADTNLPVKPWMNICEISGFLMFFPIVFYAMGYKFLKFRKYDLLQLSLAAYIIFLLFYVLVGFPLFLSKITLLSMSPSFRALPILEAGNVILLICFLSDREFHQKIRFSWIEFAILSFTVIVFFVLLGKHINKATENFFSTDQLIGVTAIFSAIYLLIRYKYLKYATPALCFSLLAVTISNANVNPLIAGLAPVLENPLVKTSRAVYEKDPKAGWAVFGNDNWADLLKVNGIKVFNGVKLVPPLNEMKILDSTGKYDSAYNRFAHVTMKMYINWKDTVIIRQTYSDGYTIFMDPCSPRFKQLGVKYFVFSYQPQKEEIRCMTPIDTVQFFMYKRKEE